MGQVNATRNPENVLPWLLENNADLYTVYDWASEHGYSAYMNTDSNGVRTISFTAPGGNASSSAKLGDLIILKNDVELTVVPAAQVSTTPGVGLWTISPAA